MKTLQAMEIPMRLILLLSVATLLASTVAAHTLSASMSGSRLTVTADNGLVWQGDLGPVALEFDGPVGVRSDNAHVVFDFIVNK